DTSEIINFLKNIEDSDLESRLDKLCSMVKMAKSIIFLGIGSSGILCKYAARYFSAIGKFTFHIDDPFFPKNFKCYGESLIIALSVSGETPTTIENIIRFKKENCIIASITNTENCTIAKISNLNLPYYVQQVKVNYSDITTQIPVLYMIERIGKKLYNEYGIE
ncbi:MAG: MurR/RpiR family transcriptional regulator, partial [Clostridium sp.]|nr:MurR/RpiR family transcriptional regulator [Clostridium sp.]